MADTITANHRFTQPEIGSSKDTWGTKLNNNFTILDRILGLTAPNGLFMPRSGGLITGGLQVGGNADYLARMGDAGSPIEVRRKSDNVLAYSFDGARAIAGTVSALETVLNARMGDARYMRPGSDSTFTGASVANVLLGHTTRTFAIRRKSDNVDTHSIWDDDVTSGEPSQPSSLLTRLMGDTRYARKDVGNTFTLPQYIDADFRVRGNDAATVRMAEGSSSPFFVARKSDNAITHMVHPGDISDPDTPSSTRSILTAAMADNRYIRSNDANIARRNIDNSFATGQTVRNSVAVQASGSGDARYQLYDASGRLGGEFIRPTSGNLLYMRAVVLGTTSYRDMVLDASSGVVTATAFAGDGSRLTNLQAADIAGTLADARIPTNIVRNTRAIGAGGGLTGGGDLGGDRTIALGTPSSITDTSSNSVTTTSHTHELDGGAVRRIIAASAAGSIGSYALMRTTTAGLIGPGTLRAGSQLQYAAVSGQTSAPNDPATTAGGTWRCMGWASSYWGMDPDDAQVLTTLWQRIS